MKPAREPASSRPKPCASLKKPHESCPFAAPCGPRRNKNDRVRHQLFSQKPPGSRFRFSRTGVQPSPGSSPIELLSAFAESGAYPPDRELPGSPRQCSLPLACRHPLEGHQIGARKRRTPENTILSEPYCRRVSTDRPNREGSLLTASLEGEPGPTPAGKTLPHSYPETRFRRERAGLLVVAWLIMLAQETGASCKSQPCNTGETTLLFQLSTNNAVFGRAASSKPSKCFFTEKTYGTYDYNRVYVFGCTQSAVESRKVRGEAMRPRATCGLATQASRDAI